MRSRLIVIVGLVAVVVAVGTIAVLNGRGGPETYDPDTPQATVQAYFQALIDDRPDEALELVADDLGCENRFGPTVTVSRVVLDSVTYNSDRNEASVRVQVTETWGGGLLGPDESTFTETIHLTYTDAGTESGGEGDSSELPWRITEPPWPYFDCRTGG